MSKLEKVLTAFMSLFLTLLIICIGINVRNIETKLDAQKCRQCQPCKCVECECCEGCCK